MSDLTETGSRARSIAQIAGLCGLLVLATACRNFVGGLGGGAGLPGTSPMGGPSGTPLPSTQLPSGEVSPPSLEWPDDGTPQDTSGGSGASGEDPAQLPQDALPEGAETRMGEPLPGDASALPGSGSSNPAGSDAAGEGLDPSAVDWSDGYESLGGVYGDQSGAYETQAQRVAAAERALQESIADYDSELLEESRAAPQAPADATSSTGIGPRAASGSMSGSAPPGGPLPNASGTNASGTARDATASQAAGASAGGSGSGGAEAPDARAGDGGVDREPPDSSSDREQDDDVVARQLREAAEAETDPELKEKLWEEYRRYKEGL